MKHLPLIVFLWFPTLLLAQGIQGTVYTPGGDPLPYATIYIPKMETGTSTNDQGQYEISLAPGTYRLVFQHLGYASVVREVEVEDVTKSLDVILSDQVIQLQEVEIRAGAEDPAYTIMRKAITKSKYHDLQVQSYKAKVYIKGAGRIKDIPWLLEKAIEEEGIDSSTVFLTESVSEVTFEQPNTINEKVISIRDIGDQNQTSPNALINGSFYKPEVAGAISPLSPRAFAYYRFRYAGFFTDRDYVVNKIRVIPRSRGNDVFDGYIYIVEDLWSIHSLSMHTYKQGFKIDVEQVYAPIMKQVWMPVSHNIQVDAKVLGVAFEYKYLATVSNYDITLNPDLAVEELVVVDEKTDKALAASLEEEEKIEKGALSPDTIGIFNEKRRFTRKELRKTLRAYEKELEKSEEEPDIVAYRNMSIDSTAYQQDSSYWTSIRPVPLSEMEQKSYQKLDSMAIAKEKEEAEDSGDRPARRNAGLQSIFFGTSFDLGEHTSLEYTSPLSEFNFNTVEGYHIALPLTLRTRFCENDLTIAPTLRYAFARQILVGKVENSYDWNGHLISLSGGRYVSQFNAREPIHPIVNTYTTLWLEQNFLKLYQQDFAELGWQHSISDEFTLEVNLGWAERQPLYNNTTHTWIDQEDRAYTPNAPVNIILEDTDFTRHDAVIASLKAQWKPFLKYRVRNGKRSIINPKSPHFVLSYQKGIPDVLDSQVDFDVLELSVQHQFEIGVRGKLDYRIDAGAFLNNQSLFFMDFQHFMGNRTVLQLGDPVGSYRLLDYYRYSTDQQYISGYLQYQFRRFLLTQIFEVQLLGIKENLLFNYLKTPGSPHYMELGYGLDNILRFLRIEAVANFENGAYRGFGIRVGVATSLEDIFD